MKTKLEIAHEWAIELLRNGDHSDDVISCAWRYADAMQAEANKRLVEAEYKEEWQPDWSQAPNNADSWTMRPDGKCIWWKGKPLFDGSCFYDAVGICHTVGYAPSFNYQGDWRDSLRKRPN